MKEKKKLKGYYKKFLYRIEKKITVQDHKSMKDYAQLGCYLYIIHDSIDDNRFFYISSNHYEVNTKINPETFNLMRITSYNESLRLNIKQTKFGDKYFTLAENKGDFTIMLNTLVKSKTGDGKVFRKYKTHSKKIAIDHPLWYMDIIKSFNCISHKKKLLKEVLCKNEYNKDIVEHYISTLFILNNRIYQKFNDHSIIMDGGKTGKTSLIGFGNEKCDNISIAGLYGSSDSKAGKFKGGLVTLTKKTIIIDEINELVQNRKSEKILSILNTILENGEYNYIKQFSSKITSSNQFMFMGNIDTRFNFSLFLEATMGNTQTIGRRIGIITYDNNLNGFKKGLLRSEPSPYLHAISLFMSQILNKIIQSNKFITKLYNHKLYSKLEKYYKSKLTEIENNIDSLTVKQFIKSHKESIDRVVFRSLKLYIFNNIDNYINDNIEIEDNHIIYNILNDCNILLDRNIIHFKNIVEHDNNAEITSRINEINQNNYYSLPKYYQNILKLFNKNKAIINIKGVKYEELEERGIIKKNVIDIKRRGLINNNLKECLLNYGCTIDYTNKNIIFRFINKNLFDQQTKGLFKTVKKVNTNNNDIIDKISDACNNELDMGDLN